MLMPMQVTSLVSTTIPTLPRDTKAEPNHNKGMTARENEYQDHHNMAWPSQGIS